VDFKQADMYTHITGKIADNGGCNYTNGADVRQAILKMEIPTFQTPQHHLMKQIPADILKANMKILFSLIWG